MRLADYVIARLYEHHIEHIFSINGRGILYLTDAVARNPQMTCVSMNHEQGAAYAAVGYAQYRNAMGCCLVSTGCAATNAVTGLLCAWQDNVPCVFLSGNHMLHETTRYRGIPLRTFGQQEADIISVVEPLTKYAVMLTDPKMAAYELDKAFYLANEGRKGPVWIDIPLDIQDARIEPEKLRRFTAEERYPCSEADVHGIADLLRTSQRPVILLGSGVKAAHAQDAVQAFSERCHIPIVYSSSSPDVIGAAHENVIGAVGSMGGSRAGNFTVQNADLLLVLGNRLSPMTTSEEYEKFAREATIVVVDVDPAEHAKHTVRIDTLIQADVGDFIQALQSLPLQIDSARWLEKCRHWKEIFPICEDVFRNDEKVDLYELAECISRHMKGEDVALCTDAGLEELILPVNVRFGKGQHCIHPNAQGAMGFSVPAAIGAWYAGAKNVLVVVGDGSIMMNVQELLTISFYKLPIKIFVISNNGYAVIRQRQKNLFRKRTIGNDPSDGLGLADFEKLAKGFEIDYDSIDTPRDLGEKFAEIYGGQKAVLCEVQGVPEQKYLHSSYTRNANRRVVHRPLEDQSPFLERELFLREMIVEPIDQ